MTKIKGSVEATTTIEQAPTTSTTLQNIPELQGLSDPFQYDARGSNNMGLKLDLDIPVPVGRGDGYITVGASGNRLTFQSSEITQDNPSTRIIYDDSGNTVAFRNQSLALGMTHYFAGDIFSLGIGATLIRSLVDLERDPDGVAVSQTITIDNNTWTNVASLNWGPYLNARLNIPIPSEKNNIFFTLGATGYLTGQFRLALSADPEQVYPTERPADENIKNSEVTGVRMGIRHHGGNFGLGVTITAPQDKSPKDKRVERREEKAAKAEEEAKAKAEAEAPTPTAPAAAQTAENLELSAEVINEKDPVAPDPKAEEK